MLNMGAPTSDYSIWLSQQRDRYPPIERVTSRELLRCAAAQLTGEEKRVASVARRFGWDQDHLIAVNSEQAKLTEPEKRQLMALEGMAQQLWILYYSRRADQGRGSLFDGAPV